MKKGNIIAIFDFCDTLIGMQTANRFITLCYKENKNFITICNEFFRRILRKMGLLYGNKHKKWQLKQIKGLSIESVKGLAIKYVNEELLPIQNKAVVERMLWHKKQGHKIAILSGGFSEYIKEYAKIYGIDFVIATDLETKNGVFTGRILGLDCMGENKIKKIRQDLNLDNFDLSNSYAYSDHFSDMPLLNLVGHGIVVNFGQDIGWALESGYGIIDVK